MFSYAVSRRDFVIVELAVKHGTGTRESDGKLDTADESRQ